VLPNGLTIAIEVLNSSHSADRAGHSTVKLWWRTYENK
jgi:hypothetical protein